MSFTSAPLPTQDALVDKRGHATTPMIDWATELAGDVDAAPAVLTTVSQATQAASLGATSFAIGALADGLYRVSFLVRITQAATTSSSLEVLVNFTNNGVACTLTSAAIIANTPSTVASETYLVSIDSSTPITYATTYASVGATPMQYTITVAVEQVQA